MGQRETRTKEALVAPPRVRLKDAASRRPVRSGGQGFGFQQPAKDGLCVGLREGWLVAHEFTPLPTFTPAPIILAGRDGRLFSPRQQRRPLALPDSVTRRAASAGLSRAGLT